MDFKHMLIVVVLGFVVEGISAQTAAQNTTACIRAHLKRDVNTYEREYNNTAGTEIPRIKKALEKVWKVSSPQVIKTATNGQMTCDIQALRTFGENISGTPSGNAMKACANKRDSENMSREASRCTQCVFGELKTTNCQRRT